MLKRILPIIVMLSFCAFASPLIAQDHMGNICQRAQEFVSGFLKAPAMARFQPCPENNITRDQFGNYSVKGYVDAQNSFGALLRDNYLVETKYENGHWAFFRVFFGDIVCLPKIGCSKPPS